MPLRRRLGAAAQARGFTWGARIGDYLEALG